MNNYHICVCQLMRFTINIVNLNHEITAINHLWFSFWQHVSCYNFWYHDFDQNSNACNHCFVIFLFIFIYFHCKYDSFKPSLNAHSTKNYQNEWKKMFTLPSPIYSKRKNTTKMLARESYANGYIKIIYL